MHQLTKTGFRLIVLALLVVIAVFGIAQNSQAAYNQGLRAGQAQASQSSYEQGYEKGYASGIYEASFERDLYE